MNALSHFDWSAKSIAKILGLTALGALVLGLVFAVLMMPLRLLMDPGFSPRMSGVGYAEEMAFASDDSFAASSRTTNRLGIIPSITPDEVVDESAEDYEVTEYNANYRPEDKTDICATVAGLKVQADIVFERANESDQSCTHSFRVPRERTDEIVALLEGLEPEDLSVSVYTIQRTVEDNQSRVDILQAQLAEKELALTDAQASYDELTDMATRARDVESLTKLIDLKINTIDRLAQERLNLTRELDQISAEQQRQLTRIQTTAFYVSVYEDRVISWDRIADEWEYAVRQFVDDTNELVQMVSLGLVIWLLRAGLAVVYILILVGIARVVWTLGKKVWMWKK